MFKNIFCKLEVVLHHFVSKSVWKYNCDCERMDLLGYNPESTRVCANAPAPEQVSNKGGGVISAHSCSLNLKIVAGDVV